MSDANGTSDLPGSNGAKDLSMEEVLASIRRILSEEQGRLRFGQEPEGELILDSSMLISMRGVPVSEPAVKIVFPLQEGGISSEAENRYEEIEQTQHFEGFAEQPDVGQAPDLAEYLSKKIEIDSKIAIGRPDVTLEDMVREALEPMLKTWLNNNLPALVERVVRTETNRL